MKGRMKGMEEGLGRQRDVAENGKIKGGRTEEERKEMRKKRKDKRKEGKKKRKM